MAEKERERGEEEGGDEERWGGRERKEVATNNPQVVPCYRCSLPLNLGILRLFLFYSFFPRARPLLLPAALVSECYIRGGVTGALNKPLHLPPPPPSLPPSSEDSSYINPLM